MDASNPQIVINAPMDDIVTTQNDISRLSGTSIDEQRQRDVMNKPWTLPDIDPNDPMEPRKLLRKHNKYGFWSLALLRHILPRQRIVNKLSQLGDNMDRLIDYILPAENYAPQGNKETYLRVFVLLLLEEKESDIGEFVRAGVCDEMLPLRRYESTEELELIDPKSPHNPLTCFRNWKDTDKEWFLDHQWGVLVPFFKLDHQGRAENYNFEDETILPWLPWHDGNYTMTASQPSKGEGGYAEVTRKRIDPSSHGFQEVLRSVGLPTYNKYKA
jgi:hypothetical protein